MTIRHYYQKAFTLMYELLIEYNITMNITLHYQQFHFFVRRDIRIISHTHLLTQISATPNPFSYRHITFIIADTSLLSQQGRQLGQAAKKPGTGHAEYRYALLFTLQHCYQATANIIVSFNKIRKAGTFNNIYKCHNS